jgi:hypothetical protein
MTGGAKFTYSRDKGRSRPSASRGTISPHYCLHRDKALKKKKFFDEDEGVSPPLFTPASTSGMRQKKKPLGKLFTGNPMTHLLLLRLLTL